MILNVPYISGRFDYSCSEATAEMLLKYYNIKNWDQEKIHYNGYKSLEGGSTKFDKGIKKFFKRIFKDANGKKVIFNVYYNTFIDISRLKNIINNGNPIIVRISTKKNNLHSIILIGYNDKGFIYHDSDIGREQFIKFKDFYNIWNKSYIYVEKIK